MSTSPQSRADRDGSNAIAGHGLHLAGAVLSVLVLGVVSWAADTDAPDQSSRSRTRAAERNAAIRAGLPKYQPQPAKDDSRMTVAKDEAVEREGVLHLPTVTVRSGKGLSELTPYEMLTPKGRIELAQKRYPGISIGNTRGLNDGIALFMLQEDMDVAKKNELKRRVQRSTLEDTPATKETDVLLKNALARPDLHWAGQGKP